ncbi:right-handed parallel beta-helix repeat-containing protein [Paenibacillus cymbidii]|uniref:right-handed parallel beta-helix repeat-containing protein n=1 Tax=Paenibacillus cymbidii TaxID=1639034 RepID=UPI0010801676|nr:right-handed parallel beta-helix repeat-containing protein [Paenibacillus cymbidii]
MGKQDAERQHAAEPPVHRRQVLAGLGASVLAMAGVGSLIGGSNAFADAPLVGCLAVSIAELRASTTALADHMYYVRDYGKEGVFLYDPTDLASPDNLGTVIVAGSYRFKRVHGEYVNPKWFGAVGDGSGQLLSAHYATLLDAQAIFPHAIALTDTMDWIGIQGAVEYASLATDKGKEVFIPYGTYIINRQIRPEADNQTLRGSAGAVLSLNSDYSAIFVDGQSGAGTTPTRNLVLRDLTLVANTGHGPADRGIISLRCAQDVLLDNIRITADNEELALNSRECNGISLGSEVSGVVRNVWVEGTTLAGIAVKDGASGVTLSQCEVKLSSGPAGDVPGIELAACEQVIVDSCQLHLNQGAGVLLVADEDAEPQHVEISETFVFSNGAQGFLLTSLADGYNPQHVRISTTSAHENTGDGIRIEAGVNIAIADHTSHHNGGSGIDIAPKYTATSPYNVSRVDIQTPASYDNGQSSTAAGIRIAAAERVSVKGGSVYDDQSTQTQEYGIQFVADANSKPIAQLVLEGIDVQGLANDYDFNSSPAASGYFRLRKLYPISSPAPTVSPESQVAAPAGSIFSYSDLNTSTGGLYIKQSGTGTTGWKAASLI